MLFGRFGAMQPGTAPKGPVGIVWQGTRYDSMPSSKMQQVLCEPKKRVVAAERGFTMCCISMHFLSDSPAFPETPSTMIRFHYLSPVLVVVVLVIYVCGSVLVIVRLCLRLCVRGSVFVIVFAVAIVVVCVVVCWLRSGRESCQPEFAVEVWRGTLPHGVGG